MKDFVCREAMKTSQKLFPVVKMTESGRCFHVILISVGGVFIIYTSGREIIFLQIFGLA